MSDDIRGLVTKVDELIKHASNRAEPSVAYNQARELLKEAEWQLDDLPGGDDRDHLMVEVGRRHDDLNRLLLLDQDSMRTDLSQPIIADELPQPTAATLQRTVTERVPPNQRLVTSWPVLHIGRVPQPDLVTWKFAATGKVATPTRWTWNEFRSLPTVTLTSDFHCVTGWSRLDNTWEGVRFRDVAEAAGVRPEATHAVVNGANAYTANLDLPTLMGDDVLFAWSHDGRELTPEHGGPLRLVVPSRYAWKSVKWVSSVQFLDRDVAGYWEMRGYHNVADPWLEQRYS